MKLRIRQEREKRNWSQRYVAQEVGISREALHYIECGQRKPSYTVLVKLENLFQMGHREMFAEAMSQTDDRTGGNPAQYE